jgi:hypothetical protein
MLVRWLEALACSVGAVTGCQSPGVESQGVLCTYHQTIACIGENGCQGISTCSLDLSSWGPCVCPDAGRRDAAVRDGAKDGH